MRNSLLEEYDSDPFFGEQQGDDSIEKEIEKQFEEANKRHAKKQRKKRNTDFDEQIDYKGGRDIAQSKYKNLLKNNCIFRYDYAK